MLQVQEFLEMRLAPRGLAVPFLIGALALAGSVSLVIWQAPVVRADIFAGD